MSLLKHLRPALVIMLVTLAGFTGCKKCICNNDEPASHPEFEQHIPFTEARSAFLRYNGAADTINVYSYYKQTRTTPSNAVPAQPKDDCICPEDKNVLDSFIVKAVDLDLLFSVALHNGPDGRSRKFYLNGYRFDSFDRYTVDTIGGVPLSMVQVKNLVTPGDSIAELHFHKDYGVVRLVFFNGKSAVLTHL